MSGSDDGRGNSEEREGGPPARVLPGGQIVQPGQVDRLRNIERDALEVVRARWRRAGLAGPSVAHAEGIIAALNEAGMLCAPDADRGAVGALQRYGSHDDDCRSVRPGIGGECDCGWDATRTRVGGQS